VSVPASDTFNLSNNFTVEMWVKSNPSNTGEEFFVGNYGTGAGLDFKTYDPESLVSTAWGSTDGGYHFLNSDYSSVWISGGWNHIALTVDSDFNITEWVNGVSIGTTNDPSFSSSGTGIYIGGGLGTFNGSIDEVRFSNTVRYTSTFTPATSFTSDGNTVALWKFNEGSGTSATDSSNNGHNGTLTGTPTPTWVNGVTSSTGQNDGGQQNTSGHALQFDGSQNYLSVPSMSQFSGTNWTIEFWFKTTLNDTNMVISSDTDDSIRMGLKDQHPYFEAAFEAYDNFGNFHPDSNSYYSSLAYNDGNWHHLAVSSDGTTARFFIDGQVQQEWDGSFSKRADPHGFKIAFQQFIRAASPSTIDNLRISNTARYTSNFTPATSFTSDGNTVALYKFDEGSGTSVSDSSSHGYTATLGGSPAPSWVAGK